MTRAAAFASLTAVTLLAGACASAPTVSAPPPPTFERKLAWILQMEDQRVLHLPTPPLSAATAQPGPHGTVVPVAPVAPDLLQLLADAEPRVRRRAALAVGRAGLKEGVPALVPLLASDIDPEVRQMAAFAIGLIGDASGTAPLASALADSSPLVQGRAADGLGLIGAKDQASAIAAMAAVHVTAGALNGIAPDDLTYPLAPPTEAVRLAVFALARLKAYDALAALVLDKAGQPVSAWWPIAYALRRSGDPRAGTALLALLGGQGVYTRAFAARGLGAVGSPVGVDRLVSIAGDAARDPFVGAEAIRALGELKAGAGAAALVRVAQLRTAPPSLRAEAITALGRAGTVTDAEQLLDLLSDREPSLRAAAFGALAALDPDRLLSALSGLDPDPDAVVRAAVVTALAGLPEQRGSALAARYVADRDPRVVAAACRALGTATSPETERALIEQLAAKDPVVRAAAAGALGERKAVSAVAALRAALEAAAKDELYAARAAILEALVVLDKGGAPSFLATALGDRDWAVRVKAATLLRQLDPARDTDHAIRPAPTTLAADVYASPGIVAPRYTTELYLDTDKGAIRIALAMLDAPLTVHTMVTLARQGYFDGLSIHRVVPAFVVQDGDPRGDGEGGPGFTIRDELSERPYLRGTVGMALDWRDTGGSQYFVTVGPQPHLDGRYTVIGQVIDGMDVVDRLVVGDVVRRVRVWDGNP